MTVAVLLQRSARSYGRQTDGKYLLLQRSAQKDFAAGKPECVKGACRTGREFL